jgi:type IV secretion system protein TrbE
LSAVWAGEARCEHLDGPPLLLAKTKGATPFRLTLHVGDVGHSLIVGPTGAGKSVLLSVLALQFRRYQRSQLVIFDKGRSARAATLGLGGGMSTTRERGFGRLTGCVASLPMNGFSSRPRSRRRSGRP